MSGKIVELPDGFIGKDDEARLESFGGHLIGRGRATRWHWNRERGVDIAFELFRGGADEAFLLAIKRDRVKDVFYILDAAGERLEEGKLDHVMTVVDSLTRAEGDDALA